MAEGKVYLVIGEQGEYSDFTYRILSIWDDEQKALAEVARLDASLPPRLHDWESRWSFQIEERPLNVGLDI